MFSLLPLFGWLHSEEAMVVQQKPQNASRGDSLSVVSDGEQDVKMVVRSGTEVMKHTEVVNEVNGFTPPSLLESDLTQGMKQLQLSSNGDISFLPPR